MMIHKPFGLRGDAECDMRTYADLLDKVEAGSGTRLCTENRNPPDEIRFHAGG